MVRSERRTRSGPISLPRWRDYGLELEIAIWRKHPQAFPAEKQPDIKTGRVCEHHAYRNKEKKISESLSLRGSNNCAALRLWPELPREAHEKRFETAVPFDPMISLAIFLHAVIQGRRIA